jgi:hypothetical protein
MLRRRSAPYSSPVQPGGVLTVEARCGRHTGCVASQSSVTEKTKLATAVEG